MKSEEGRPILQDLEKGETLSKYRNDHIGEKIFFPHEDFYGAWSRSPRRLAKMATELAVWLSMEPRDISVAYDARIREAGGYVRDGNKDLIFVHPDFADRPFDVAAIIAHQLMHVLMHRAGITCQNYEQNEKETDLLTLVHKLGIVMMNGIPKKRLFGQKKKWHVLFDADDYVKHFAESLKKAGLSKNDVIGFIHPDSRRYLKNLPSIGPVKKGLVLLRRMRRRRFLIRTVVLTLVLGAAIFSILYKIDPYFFYTA